MERKDIQYRKIVELNIDKMVKMLAAQNLRCKVDASVIDYLSKSGFQPEFGARPIKRLINQDILSKISKYIIEQPDIVSIRIVFNKEIRIEDGSKNNLKKAG